MLLLPTLVPKKLLLNPELINPAHLPKPTKEEIVVEGSEDHFSQIPSDVKKKMRAHLEKGDHEAAAREAHKAGHLLKYHSLVRNAAHSFHQDYDTRHHDITYLHPYMSDYLKEDVEQVDEISKHKLVQYIDKAADDVHKKALEAGKHADQPGKASDFIKNFQKPDILAIKFPFIL